MRQRDPSRRRRRRPLSTDLPPRSTASSLVYDAIEIESKLILDAALFSRYDTDPAAVFLQLLCEKHDLSDVGFLVD